MTVANQAANSEIAACIDNGVAHPRVSVVVPNYNHARYLPQRLDSILGQTFRDFELLILDDASPDDSRSVIERYAAADPRARCIFNERNSGSTFKQWNKGVLAARGEYVWIAESDDFADERLLGRLVAVLDAHPSCGLAYCQSWEVDSEGVKRNCLTSHTDDLDPRRWSHDFVMNGRDACMNYMAVKNIIPNASAALFRRSVYMQAGGADEGFRVTGDWKLWTDMLMLGDLGFVAEPLNYFRRHANNVRSHSRKSGTGLAEYIAMVSYVPTQVRPTRVARAAAAEAMARALIHGLAVDRISLRRGWELYSSVRRVFPGIDGRIVRQIATAVSRRASKPMAGRATSRTDSGSLER